MAPTLRLFAALFGLVTAVVCVLGSCRATEPDHLVFSGPDGPGTGKHIVLLAGDDEYRSEEALPMLAQMLAGQGFRCTVLFSLDDRGYVDPKNHASLSHPEALDSADAIVMALRFRSWNDTTMERFEAALHRGVPIVALRTSTHAFDFPADSRWARYSYNAGEATGWEGGFGRQVLGETWRSHHGEHKQQGTRSQVEEANRHHVVLHGVGTIFATTDVYEAHPPEDSSTILLRGAVTASLDPSSPAIDGPKNNPMQPIAWIREVVNAGGTTNRVFTTTMGAATDLVDPNLRRLVANAVYWGLGLEPDEGLAGVALPGRYEPTDYGFDNYRTGQRPSDFVLDEASGPDANASTFNNARLRLNHGSRIALLGGGLCAKMLHDGEFETELAMRYPDYQLVVRNLCDDGNTPAFRQHSGRATQTGFPGAERFIGAYTDDIPAPGEGHFPTEEEWLRELEADIVIGFFGFSESFRGTEGLASYRAELDTFVQHTQEQLYNGRSAPQLALVSPTAFEDRSEQMHVPNGQRENANLRAYAEVMRDVAREHGIVYVEAFSPSRDWYATTSTPLTTDGASLNEAGHRRLAVLLADGLFGVTPIRTTVDRQLVHAAVDDKNWHWANDFKIPNGIHAFGRRFKPFGPDNYPDEIKKIRELTTIRDRALWSLLAGEVLDVAALDAATHPLPPIATNYPPSTDNNQLRILYGEQARASMTVPPGYRIDLWASEQEFPDLANPVQMSFDDQGRFWVAVMPSYPHHRPGDARPDDKLLILEDTDGDGRADKQTTWADGLHLPLGFEFAPEGVYVSQEGSLVLLRDDDGDDRAEHREVILSGFDDHDSHHAISAFEADPSGAIFMAEGLFLRTSVETPYGTVRGSDGGFYRYAPQRRRLERYAQLDIPNPWGIAFDDWGQPFFLHTSGPKVEWMLPGSVKPRYGVKTPGSPNLIEEAHRVRPTSGLEFLWSRHFPDEVQGDMLLGNVIGFRGIKQHRVLDDGTGYRTRFRQDLLSSSDPNFRPVDLELAPDGSLYIVDWHNPLIGHMQHSARDPHRDHAHGRVYRITYPARPLVQSAKIESASVTELLEHLESPDTRTRYRSRRELRGRPAKEVMPALQKWWNGLDSSDSRHEHHLVEALWVTWALDRIDPALLRRVLQSPDYRARAAAVEVLRHADDAVPDRLALLETAAQDPHRRVRLAAIVAASWLESAEGLTILKHIEPEQLDLWSEPAYQTALSRLRGNAENAAPEEMPTTNLEGTARDLFLQGAELYRRDGYCGTCHQLDGTGLSASGFPPLAGSEWVTGDEERLIKIALDGLQGPIEVAGQRYAGHVPMTAFRSLLDDTELAAVLTYVRNAFGHNAAPVLPTTVERVRRSTEGRVGFYTAAELTPVSD